MPELLCAFDLGTTGVKAGILTPDGRLIASAYREYSVSYPAPQWVEQSIEDMWQAQCAACQELLASGAVKPQDIAAVAVSSQRATFAALDQYGKPLTPFIGWQDKRSLAQCAQLEQRIGAQVYYRIAGLPVEPTAAVSKILWLKENAPQIFERAAQFASTQNVHLAQLGVDDPPCDLADAAYLGLLDVDRLQWSQELLNRLGIPEEKMPRLSPSGVQVGQVSALAAQATGLRPGTPIVTAGGDLQVAGLGLGVAAPGVVSVGIGTGGGVLVFLERPLRHPQRSLNCLPHAVPGAWEMEGIVLASGAALRWFRDAFSPLEKAAAAQRGIDPYEILTAQASETPPGAGGLIVMPSLLGAGAPNWYPKMRGVVLGLTPSVDHPRLTRALLEGICLEIRWELEAARNLGTPIEEVRIWGGAAKSPVWNQIAADVYGLPAAKTAIPEGGLVGAAICAGLGVGLFASAQQGAAAMVRITERYEPNPGLRSLYDEMFDIYKSAYQALVNAGIFERLAALG